MSESGRIAGIIPAAGRGERFGAGEPKALRLLAGEPLLNHAVRALTAARCVDPVVVAVPPERIDDVTRLLPSPDRTDVTVVGGGATRQASVALALAALPTDVEIVLVHDAARPLAPPALVDVVAEAVRAGADAVAPALPVVDTVKRVDSAGRVVETLDRADLRAVQTPQGFRREVLARAHLAPAHPSGAADTPSAGGLSDAVTDDAGLVERLGHVVHVVPGSDAAFKVTRPPDLLLAEIMLSASPPVPADAR